MKRIVLVFIIFAFLSPAYSQRVLRIAKGYVALQNENVGSDGEELIIRRPVNGKLIDIGMVRVILSKEGKTAARILQEVHPYHIQPGDVAFRLKTSGRKSGPAAESSWRFEIGPGYGRRIGNLAQNIPPDLEAYHDRLRSGFSVNAEMVYFHSPSSGIGWMVSQWWSDQSAGDKILYNRDLQPLDLVDLENHSQIFYTGPLFAVNQALPNSRLNFHSAVTIGLLQFQDKQTTTFSDPIKKTEETIGDKTVGIGGEIGLNARISASVGVYGRLLFLFGTLPRQVSDSNLYQDRISLNRLDFTAGLSLYF